AGGGCAKRLVERTDVVFCVDCLDVSNNIGAYEGARGAGVAVGGKTRKVIDLSLNDFAVEHWTNLGGPLPPVDVQLQADGLYGLNQVLDALRRRAAGNPPWVARAAGRRAEIGEMHTALRTSQREAMKAKWDHVPIYPPRL